MRQRTAGREWPLYDGHIHILTDAIRPAAARGGPRDRDCLPSTLCGQRPKTAIEIANDRESRYSISFHRSILNPFPPTPTLPSLARTQRGRFYAHGDQIGYRLYVAIRFCVDRLEWNRRRLHRRKEISLHYPQKTVGKVIAASTVRDPNPPAASVTYGGWKPAPSRLTTGLVPSRTEGSP